MKVLVTGANGFVGKWLCADFLSRGHEVLGGVRSLTELAELGAEWRRRLEPVTWLEMDLERADELDAAVGQAPQAVVHLAAVASGSQARANPLMTWSVNCLGTCALLDRVERRGLETRILMISTGEVYGAGLTRPAAETDPLAPCSPYAASKAAAELAVQEFGRRTAADTVIARLFPVAGPGQPEALVASALARRILAARESGQREIAVGNLAPVRELIDVRDASVALCLLLERGESGGVYNVARGEGIALTAVLDTLAELIGWSGVGVPDPGLFRQADIPYLVGDRSRIAALGWSPRYQWRATLQDLVSSL